MSLSSSDGGSGASNFPTTLSTNPNSANNTLLESSSTSSTTPPPITSFSTGASSPRIPLAASSFYAEALVDSAFDAVADPASSLSPTPNANTTTNSNSLSSVSLPLNASSSSSSSPSSSFSSSFSSNVPFRCPIDRHVLVPCKDIAPAAFVITSLVNDLLVKCPYSSSGCEFRDKRWLLQKHVDSDCLYVLVPCQDPQCGKMVPRHMLHPTKCLHTVVVCPNDCGHNCAELDLDEHLRVCDLSESSTDLVESTASAATAADVASVGPTKCSAHDLGCRWELPSGGGGGHSEDNSGDNDDDNADDNADDNDDDNADDNDDKDKDDLSALQDHEQTCVFMALKKSTANVNAKIDRVTLENSALRAEVERLTTITSIYDINNTASSVAATQSTSSSSSPARFNDADLLHMFMECERLRRDVDHLNTSTNDMYIRQGEMLMRENIRLSEEIAVLRSGFNSLRHQIHFLLTERRTWSNLHLQSRVGQTLGSTSSTLHMSDHPEPFRDVKL